RELRAHFVAFPEQPSELKGIVGFLLEKRGSGRDNLFWNRRDVRRIEKRPLRHDREVAADAEWVVFPRERGGHGDGAVWMCDGGCRERCSGCDEGASIESHEPVTRQWFELIRRERFRHCASSFTRARASHHHSLALGRR